MDTKEVEPTASGIDAWNDWSCAFALIAQLAQLAYAHPVEAASLAEVFAGQLDGSLRGKVLGRACEA